MFQHVVGTDWFDNSIMYLTGSPTKKQQQKKKEKEQKQREERELYSTGAAFNEILVHALLAT